jgi:proline racemase
VLPTIAGRAWITARTELVVDPGDPATAAGWNEGP